MGAYTCLEFGASALSTHYLGMELQDDGEKGDGDLDRRLSFLRYLEYARNVLVFSCAKLANRETTLSSSREHTPG